MVVISVMANAENNLQHAKSELHRHFLTFWSPLVSLWCRYFFLAISPIEFSIFQFFARVCNCFSPILLPQVIIQRCHAELAGLSKSV